MGRPIDARNAATQLAEALLDGGAEALTRALIERALAGDPAMLKLAIERIVPRRARMTRSYGFRDRAANGMFQR